MSDFTELVNLASSRLGARALLANDEFFAPKENLLKPDPPIFIPHQYTSRGKWMDGWETRRRRAPGHDWCALQLAFPGILHGIDVETTHFIGNYPEQCLLEAAYLSSKALSPDELRSENLWTEIVPKSKLEGNTHNLFPVRDKNRWSHLRFHIYPDGGVARLRIYGEVAPDWSRIPSGELLDLAAIQYGARVVSCSDMTFSSKNNLILPGRSRNMGDGWETRRRRGPGHDWVLLKLGAPGVIQKVEVDTTHFKGNAPAECSLEGFPIQETLEDLERIIKLSTVEILPRTALQPHRRHFFAAARSIPPCSLMRFNIYPDGGVSRLRIYGIREPGR